MNKSIMICTKHCCFEKLMDKVYAKTSCMHVGSEESAPLLLAPTATPTLASLPHYNLVSGTGGLLWFSFTLLLEDQLCDSVEHLRGRCV